jgi:alpha-tubulin suppressor-like RCC1 family protein
VALSGETYCWGDNGSPPLVGQLGDGSTTSRPTPTRVRGNLQLHSLALGVSSCGLTRAGAAYCWGPRLGAHNGESWLEPTLLESRVAFDTISSTFGHVCGLTAEGAAWCWGSNYAGELGDGTLVDSPVPVPVSGGLQFIAISAGYSHTCGLISGGTLTCWGWDDLFVDSREFNNGTSIHSPGPVTVPGGRIFVQMSEGMVHGCGVTAEQNAYCWFDNSDGQLGRGDQIGSYEPVAVR